MYWEERVEQLPSGHVIIIDGVCYYDGGNVPSPTNYDYLGFGGRKFKIRMNDGREFVTNNLYLNDKVPKEYRDRLPDNATFVK